MNFHNYIANVSASNSSNTNYKETGVWNKVMELIVLALVSTLGTMGNIFVISAIIVIPLLKTKGNAFVVSLAIADLLVTGLVIPASCVAILAGSHHSHNNREYYCNFQWQVTIVYLFVTSMTFLSISLENLAGVSNVVTYDRCCGSKVKVTCVILLTWVVSICIVGIQHMYQFGPNLCTFNFKVSVKYHLTIAITLLAIPVTVAFASFVRAMAESKRQEELAQAAEEGHKDPVILLSLPITDYKLLKSNFIVFGLYITLWMPLCILVGMGIAGRLPINLVTGLWWLALSNGCVHSYGYAATNPYFREAFNKLFYYCCCKTHVSFARIRRQDAARPTPDDNQSQALRVHIIHGLNLYAQRKENITKLSSGSGMTTGQKSGAYEL